MIADPRARGVALARFFRPVEARLWNEIEAAEPTAATPIARAEWECFALYACVRGLVAAGGFNRETAAAIDALHEHVLAEWMAEDADGFAARRGRIAERYAEYGTIGQEGGAAGAVTVASRLGAACARHMAGEGASADLAELVGALHETLAEGATEAVRIAE